VVLFVLIFPAVGFGVVFFSLKSAAGTLNLLRYGVLTQAVLTSCSASQSQANPQMVDTFLFEFTDRYRQTHTVSMWNPLSQPPAIGNQKYLLYMPDKPQIVVFLERLPGKITINTNNRIERPVTLGDLAVLVVPVLSVCGHGLYLVLRFS
jgi:hypothetical protein